MNNALYVDVTVKESESVDATVKDVMEIPGSGGGTGGTNDYRQLSNLPSLNGRKIIGDISETDPTVPGWAKEPFPPVSEDEFAELQAKVGEMLPVDAVIPSETIDKLFSGNGMVAEASVRVAVSVSYVDLSGLQKTVNNTLGLLGGKVEKVPGKGLSTNDFDNTAKNKLSGIENGANRTVVDSELDAESQNPVQNAVVAQLKADLSGEIKSLEEVKAPVNSPAFTGVPTAPTATVGTKSEQLATTQFVVDMITQAMGDMSGIGVSVVQQLPDTGKANTLYMVPNTAKSENSVNQYDEFMWINEAWEYIGASGVDLTGYVKETDMEEITFEQIEQMFIESGAIE